MNDKFFSMDLRDPCSGCPFRQYQELQRNSQLLEDDKSKLSRTYPADLDKALAQSPMQVKKLTKHVSCCTGAGTLDVPTLMSNDGSIS